VIFADEPTGALDSRNARDVLAMLRDVTELRGPVSRAITKPDPRERIARDTPARPLAREPQRQDRVLRRGQRRQQVERLKDKPDAAATQ